MHHHTALVHGTVDLCPQDFCPLCDSALEELGSSNLSMVSLQKVDIEEEGQEDWWQLYRY